MDRETREKIAEIRQRIDRPVALVGLMGAGKTRVGRELARTLKLAFYDADDEIEKAAGMTIADIFERFGEQSFRDGEKKVIARLLGEGPCVIATGGGAMMNPETAEALRSQALSIWIRADIDVIVKRTARRNHRPLLRGGDPASILADLAEKRYPVYETAALSVESGEGSASRVVIRIIDRIYSYLLGEYNP